MEISNQTDLPFLQSAFFQDQSLGSQRFSISKISAIPCQSPKRPLNCCFEYPAFALVGSFSTHEIYLRCNGSPHSLIRRQHLSQSSLHRLLFSPRSTIPSHSPTNSLMFSGASHKAQCPVLTSLLDKLGINPSMPSDIDGGKASSLVAWIKRTGTLMILFVSLCRLRSLYVEGKRGREGGTYCNSSLKFTSRLRYQFTRTLISTPLFFFKRIFQR